MHLRAFIKRWIAYRALSSSSNSSTDDLAPTSALSDKKDRRRSSINNTNRSSSSSSSSSPPSLSPSRSAAPSPMPSPSRSPEPVRHLPATSNNLRKKARKASSTPSTRSTTPVKGGNGSSIGNGREKVSMETPPLSCCSKEIAEDPFARVCPSPIPFKKRPPISPLSASSPSSSPSNAYPFTPPNSAHNSLVCSPTSFSSSFSSSSHSHISSAASCSSKMSTSSSLSSMSGVSGCSTITYTTLETPSTSPNLAVSFSSSTSSAGMVVDKNKRLPLPPAFVDSQSKKLKKEADKKVDEGKILPRQIINNNNRKAAHPYSKFIEHGLDVFMDTSTAAARGDGGEELAFSNLVEIPSSAAIPTPVSAFPQHKFSKMRSFTAPPVSLAHLAQPPSSSFIKPALPSSPSSSSLAVSPASPVSTNAQTPPRPIYIKKNKSFIGLPREKQRFDPEARGGAARKRKHASASLLLNNISNNAQQQLDSRQEKRDCLGIEQDEGKKDEEEEDWFAKGF